jgi:type IV pilus assembly protein PilN
MQIAQHMIRINLLPSLERAKTHVQAPSLTSLVPFIAICGVIGALAVVSTFQSLKLRSLRTEITTLKAESAKLEPLIARIDQLTAERELTLRRLGVIEELDRERLARVRLSDELARRLPDHLWLTGFSERAGAISLNGVTFSNLSVAEFIRTLDRSVLYEGVDLVVAERGTIDDREVVNFSLSARRQTTPEPEATASTAGQARGLQPPAGVAATQTQVASKADS